MSNQVTDKSQYGCWNGHCVFDTYACQITEDHGISHSDPLQCWELEIWQRLSRSVWQSVNLKFERWQRCRLTVAAIYIKTNVSNRIQQNLVSFIFKGYLPYLYKTTTEKQLILIWRQTQIGYAKISLLLYYYSILQQTFLIVTRMLNTQLIYWGSGKIW